MTSNIMNNIVQMYPKVWCYLHTNNISLLSVHFLIIINKYHTYVINRVNLLLLCYLIHLL